jgi:hypothetical protein
MSVSDRDADENELRLELYLSISSLFSGEMPSYTIDNKRCLRWADPRHREELNDEYSD